MALRPVELIFSCYAYEAGSDQRWQAVCVDLDLWASGKSYEDARQSLDLAIQDYVEAVMDTQDLDSIAPLLRRRAPLHHVARYYWLRLRARLGAGPGGTSRGYESVPRFHIGTAPA